MQQVHIAALPPEHSQEILHYDLKIIQMQTKGCLKYTLHHFLWLLHIKAIWPTDSNLQVSRRTQQDECKEAEADTSPTPTAFEQTKNTETTPK